MATMALSEENKERIREEEAYRIKVRQELARKSPEVRRKTAFRTALFWIVLIGAALALFAILHQPQP